MPKKQDRRVERTQQLLRQALRSLIQEKGFEALTVQQIIDRANVGRATFYAHFDNKDDLLASGFEDLRASLKARQRDAFTRGRSLEDRVLAFSEEMFAHANEYREVFSAMVGRRSGIAVKGLIRKLLLDLVREDIRSTMPGQPAGSVPAEALAQFLAGALFGVLIWWVGRRTPLSAEDVNAIFRKLAIPTVKAAAR